MDTRTDSPPTLATPPCTGSGRAFVRLVILGAITGLAVVFLTEIIRIFVAGNVHAVLPGEVFRSSQLSQATLESTIRQKGIQTVVNLRGCCASFAWYQSECRAVRNSGIVQEDVCLSSGRLPSTGEIRRLVEVLERSPYPLIFHCHRGIDRTGLAAVMVLLLMTETPLDTALQQLGLRYGHLHVGRTGRIDEFFALYRRWLERQDLPHSPTTFRRWAWDEYRPADCYARVELTSPIPPLKPLRPVGVRVRATNLSVETWRFRPNRLAGVHLRYIIHNQRGVCIATGLAGLFHAEVPPGEDIELTLPLPALHRGRYSLIIDMEHAGHCLFFQAGSEPIEKELVVGE